MCRTDLTRPPQLGQIAQEAFQTLASRHTRRVCLIDGGERRLCLPYRMQQQYRIKFNPTVPEHRLGILAHVVSQHQTVAGCGKCAISLLHSPAVTSPLQQLERWLKVIHVQTHRTVEVRHSLTGHRSGVTFVSDEATSTEPFFWSIHAWSFLRYTRERVNSIPRSSQYANRVSLMNTLSLSEFMPRTGTGKTRETASSPSTTRVCSRASSGIASVQPDHMRITRR